jgi:hypothetical protein
VLVDFHSVTFMAGARQGRTGRKVCFMADLIEQCRAAGQMPEGNAHERAPEKQQSIDRDTQGAAAGRNTMQPEQDLSQSTTQEQEHERER